MNQFPPSDFLVNLTGLPALPVLPEGLTVRPAYAGDRAVILDFVRERFSPSWVAEAECALTQMPCTCLIATQGETLVGFACYDVSARGFFGPIGVDKSMRGKNVGQALLLHTLYTMRAVGYGYAIIGWVTDAAPFYEKTVGALRIPDSAPEKSVFSHMIRKP